MVSGRTKAAANKRKGNRMRTPLCCTPLSESSKLCRRLRPACNMQEYVLSQKLWLNAERPAGNSRTIVRGSPGQWRQPVQFFTHGRRAARGLENGPGIPARPAQSKHRRCGSHEETRKPAHHRHHVPDRGMPPIGSRAHWKPSPCMPLLATGAKLTAKKYFLNRNLLISAVCLWVLEYKGPPVLWPQSPGM